MYSAILTGTFNHEITKRKFTNKESHINDARLGLSWGPPHGITVDSRSAHCENHNYNKKTSPVALFPK